MKQLAEFIKQHKKTFVLALLLILFASLAIALYGSSLKGSKVTSAGIDRTANETKLMRILSEIDGVGDAEVMISEENGEIGGVIIVCQGADNLITRNNVINVVTAVFNVKKSNIAIYAMK